jgi:SAM-dependent methyltransferase
MGAESFERTRRAFSRLVRRHDIQFRTVADLGCGTGMFARYLARCWGARVFAVDRSAAMLRCACQRAAGEAVEYLWQDLRCLRLPQCVDLATANFDTLNHLTKAHDLQRVLARVAASLEPDGFFLFDIVTPCAPLGGRRWFARTFAAPSAHVAQTIAWDPREHLIRIQVVIDEGGPSAAVEHHCERAWKPSSVARWLMDAGFVIRGVYDAATLQPADVCPPRIIVVAQRRACASN